MSEAILMTGMSEKMKGFSSQIKVVCAIVRKMTLQGAGQFLASTPLIYLDI